MLVNDEYIILNNYGGRIVIAYQAPTLPPFPVTSSFDSFKLKRVIS